MTLVVGDSALSERVHGWGMPKSDALLVADTLEQAGFGPVIGGQARWNWTRQASTASSSAWVAKLMGADVALFYAGHGIPGPQTIYLVPISANPSTPG